MVALKVRYLTVKSTKLLTLLPFLQLYLLAADYPLPRDLGCKTTRWLVVSNEGIQLRDEDLRRNGLVFYSHLFEREKELYM